MSIEKIIFIMRYDYGFVFRVNFGLTKTTISLNICKAIGNHKEKVIYFMNTLLNNGFIGEYNSEEEETVFTNKDGLIVIRISQ